MKYIRTKNGIYEVVEDNNKEWGKQIVVKFPKNLNMKLADVKDQILKQADTIEELCDGFYNDILGDGYFNFDGLYIYNDFESFKEDWKAYRVHDNWEGDGYGFIKTPKGLIYVAKMNNIGDLELCQN